MAFQANYPPPNPPSYPYPHPSSYHSAQSTTPSLLSSSTFQILHSPTSPTHIITTSSSSSPSTAPLFTLTNFGTESPLLITSPTNSAQIIATITTHSSTWSMSAKKSYIEIAIPQQQPGSAPQSIKLQRDPSALTRRHRFTSPTDGKTYVVRGKHSDSVMMSWGNLRIEEAETGKRAVEFDVEWMTSLRKVGTVRFLDDGARLPVGVRMEMLWAVVGVTNKEYETTKAAADAFVEGATA
ncbi:MAG: hypothetical protein Q9220_003127 [cf. Caloplaca sp. 1 TL-2023]